MGSKTVYQLELHYESRGKDWWAPHEYCYVTKEEAEKDGETTVQHSPTLSDTCDCSIVGYRVKERTYN